MSPGGRWMTMMREWKDIPIEDCPPGASAEVHIPIWHEGVLKSLEDGIPAICRCIFLDPSGFSPVTADIMIVPHKLKKSEDAMPVGPDAEL